MLIDTYEEGYDSFDAHYQAWLPVNHLQDAHMAVGHGFNSECPLSNLSPIPDRSSTGCTQSEDNPSCTILEPMDKPGCNTSFTSNS